MISDALDLLGTVAQDVARTFQHNWPYLLASVVVASIIQVYVKPDVLGALLRRRVWVAVLVAVAVGAFTPFCSCGTTAVVLGAMASSVPWAPIVAFMVSSPLTSPEQYVLSLGLFGGVFTNAYVVASVVAGLLGGAAAWWLERAGLLRGQQRVQAAVTESSCCGEEAAPQASSCCREAPATSPQSSCCGDTGAVATKRALLPLTVVAAPAPSAPALAPSRLRLLGRTLLKNLRTLALYFFGFAALGYLIIRLVPTEVLTESLGAGNPVWSVPLAALLGIPVYLNADGSLPLVASLMDGGMSPGAGLAFLITGAGTSVGAISGMLVIARWRIVALVVGTLLLTAVLAGWLLAAWM